MIFGINTTSNISKLLYVISRALRRLKFEKILKYHEWYLCQISRTNYAIICFYYTSDSLWKIWLVESIQSIHNSLWTWHDKCNICCRYCFYHVKFNVCLVTKPLGVFSSETEWLNVFFCLLCKKCIIKQLLNSVFAWYHGFDNSWYHAQPHPIIIIV